MLRRLSLGTWCLLVASALFAGALVATQLVAGSPARFLAPPLAVLTSLLVFRWLRPKWRAQPVRSASYDRLSLAGWAAALGMSVAGPLLRSFGEGAAASGLGLACGFVLGATGARLASEIQSPQGSR